MIFTNEDCMDLMARYEDKHFDLAIVDPPYGISVSHMSMGSRAMRPDNRNWDDKPPTKEYFDELFRVSKNQIVWGGNYFGLPPTRCYLVWDKGNTIKGRDFAEAELAWTSFDKVVRIFVKSPHEKKRIHTCQKPIELYKWILKNYAKKGDLILDTHVGSASSLIACEELGFDYVGCEREKDYFENACKRIDTYRQQMRMF